MNTHGNIPFSWENRPGVRKDNRHESLVGDGCMMAAVHDNSYTEKGTRVVVRNNSSTKEGRLPPPPCENQNKATCHDIALPLPPCVFQPNMRSSSRRSNKEYDPFLMAYKECTKSTKKGSLMRKNSIFGSCKYSCSVRDDSIVRVSQIPVPDSDRKKNTVD